MTETRELSTAALVSLTTGITLCPFDQIHEAAQYVMGCPIWTHHFASKEMMQKIQNAVTAQCPTIPTKLSGVNANNYLKKLAAIEAKIGKTIKIAKGDGSGAMSPLEGIPTNKPIAVITTPTEN